MFKLEHMEIDIGQYVEWDALMANSQLSIAISLKRIADNLEAQRMTEDFGNGVTRTTVQY